MLTLYGYFRSSAAYRVRIALHLKGASFDTIPVHLVRDGGEQLAAAFATLNPERLVPLLIDGSRQFTQSIAIIEYLDEIIPTPPLLPTAPAERAHVRSLALLIACDLHPLNNLRVMRYLKAECELDEQACRQWSQHWIAVGFAAIEERLRRHRSGVFCHGSTATMADCCLIPQVFNALRLDCPIERYPTIMEVYRHCLPLTAFQRAAPAAQNDAEDS